MKNIIIRKDNAILGKICMLFVASLFLGEQFKIASVPLYLYVAALCLFCFFCVEKKIHFDRVSFLILLWFCISTFLFLLTHNTVGYMPYLYCLSTLIVMMVVNLYSQKWENIEWLYYGVLIGVFITCACSTYELISGYHFVKTVYTSEYYMRLGQNSSFGFQVNINDNATVIVMGFFAIIRMFRKKPIITLGLMLWSIILVVKIASRMAIVALLVGAFIALFSFIHKKYFMNNGLFLKIAFVIVMLFVICLFALFPDVLLGIVSDKANYASDLWRVNQIRYSVINSIQNSLLLGNGAGVTQWLVGGDSLHSAFIEILGDYGFIVFLWFGSVIYSMLLAFTRKSKKTVSVYVTCFTVAFCFMSFCSSSMLRIRCVWAMLCLVWAIYQQDGNYAK